MGTRYYFRYPQYIWASEIYSILKGIDKLNERRIVDAPCGDGIISFWLKRKLKNLQFELYDLSEECVEIARRFIPDVNIICKDIFDVETKNRTEDVWLFINSLYCLKDGEMLIGRYSERMSYIIAVFPYIDHPNYHCFFKKNPDFINYSEMDQGQTIQLFRKHGYDLSFEKNVIHIPYYCYRNFRGKLMLLNIIDRFFKANSGAYWISLFKRE